MGGRRRRPWPLQWLQESWALSREEGRWEAPGTQPWRHLPSRGRCGSCSSKVAGGSCLPLQGWERGELWREGCGHGVEALPPTLGLSYQQPGGSLLCLLVSFGSSKPRRQSVQEFLPCITPAYA